MERYRCPACGDRGYVGKDLICGSCNTRLEFAGNDSLKVAGPMPKKASPLLALLLLSGLVLGGLGIMTGEPTPAPADDPPVVAASGNRPQLDVVFVIDSTGSMADEIDVVKGQVRKMMRAVQSGQPRPEVRFGLVTYRDRGDEYVTRTLPLTDDVESIEQAVENLVADGGGDTPEAVNEALHVAVAEMNWNFDQKASRLMFLIGDAAPHMDYADDYDYRQELAQARSKGIKLHTWGCSGIQDSGESEFQEMASLTGGQFEFLTYRQEVVKADGTRTSVVFQGKEAYEVTKKDADWKLGAKALKRDEAVKLPSSSYSAPTAYGAGTFSDKSYRAAAPKMENNLDRVLTEQVMEEAKAQGVSY